MWEVVLTPLLILVIAGIVVWWLTEHFGLESAHKHRIIEEHAKKVHEYSEKYYVKLIGYAEFFGSLLNGILVKLDNSEAPSNEAVEISLFGWARWSKLEDEFFKDTSALMLSDRTAEGVIVYLRAQVDELLTDKLGCISKEDDSLLRQHIQTYEPLPNFKAAIQKPPLKQIADKYRVAIQRDRELLRLLVNTLCCLHKVFHFEMNTCFDAWYSKKTPAPSFQQSEWVVLEAALDQLVKTGHAGTDDEKKAYLQRIGKLAQEEESREPKRE